MNEALKGWLILAGIAGGVYLAAYMPRTIHNVEVKAIENKRAWDYETGLEFEWEDVCVKERYECFNGRGLKSEVEVGDVFEYITYRPNIITSSTILDYKLK